MDLTSWAFYAFIVLAALAGVVAHYRLREPSGRGRGVLAALRWLSIALLVLLLFNPVLPGPAAGRGAGPLVAVDASLSMRLPDVDGRTRWEAAQSAVAELGAGRVVVFGEEGTRPVSSLDEAAPVLTGSRMAPALRSAAEQTGGRVVVVTDGAVEDPAAATALLARGVVGATVVRVGGEPAWNAGVVEVDAPSWAEVGEETELRVGIAAVGEAAADTLLVALRRDGVELARTRVPAPGPGRIESGTLRFTPQEAADGPVRLDVALLDRDAEADDNVRSVYIRISDAPAGVALITFGPDQEPRFLLPVLERALGVPTRGWMSVQGVGFISLGAGTEAGRVADAATVREAAAEADLLVLHAFGADATEWAQALAGRAPRVLVFPARGTVPGAPVEPGPERPGDWYLSPDIPATPVAPLLAGLEPGDAPPLVALRPAEAPAGFWSPLMARLGRRGDEEPVLLAGTTGGRRVAVALGDGYWRWAFAGGAGRAAYDRLWAAMAGWLMEETTAAPVASVRPVERAVPRGRAPVFTVPAAADSVRLRIVPAEPDTAAGVEAAAELDTVLTSRDGRVEGPVLPPGHYRYSARPLGLQDDAQPETVGGPLTVERYSPEFTRPVASLPESSERAGGGPLLRRPAGRPLHTTPWPYLLLVALLSVEWGLRRRWGLR